MEIEKLAAAEDVVVVRLCDVGTTAPGQHVPTSSLRQAAAALLDAKEYAAALRYRMESDQRMALCSRLMQQQLLRSYSRRGSPATRAPDASLSASFAAAFCSNHVAAPTSHRLVASPTDDVDNFSFCSSSSASSSPSPSRVTAATSLNESAAAVSTRFAAAAPEATARVAAVPIFPHVAGTALATSEGAAAPVSSDDANAADASDVRAAAFSPPAACTVAGIAPVACAATAPAAAKAGAAAETAAVTGGGSLPLSEKARHGSAEQGAAVSDFRAPAVTATPSAAAAAVMSAAPPFPCLTTAAAAAAKPPRDSAAAAASPAHPASAATVAAAVSSNAAAPAALPGGGAAALHLRPHAAGVAAFQDKERVERRRSGNKPIWVPHQTETAPFIHFNVAHDGGLVVLVAGRVVLGVDCMHVAARGNRSVPQFLHAMRAQCVGSERHYIYTAATATQAAQTAPAPAERPPIVPTCVTTPACSHSTVASAAARAGEGAATVAVDRRWEEQQQLLRFMRVWTAKEAFLKAMGTGIFVDPERVECRFPLCLRAARLPLHHSPLGCSYTAADSAAAAARGSPDNAAAATADTRRYREGGETAPAVADGCKPVPAGAAAPKQIHSAGGELAPAPAQRVATSVATRSHSRAAPGGTAAADSPRVVTASGPLPGNAEAVTATAGFSCSTSLPTRVTPHGMPATPASTRLKQGRATATGFQSKAAEEKKEEARMLLHTALEERTGASDVKVFLDNTEEQEFCFRLLEGAADSKRYFCICVCWGPLYRATQEYQQCMPKAPGGAAAASVAFKKPAATAAHISTGAAGGEVASPDTRAAATAPVDGRVATSGDAPAEAARAVVAASHAAAAPSHTAEGKQCGDGDVIKRENRAERGSGNNAQAQGKPAFPVSVLLDVRWIDPFTLLLPPEKS